MERALRGIAGVFIILSVLLAHFVDLRWLWFTLFVGANLLQSAFTNWCPMMSILRRCNITAVPIKRPTSNLNRPLKKIN